MRGLEGGENGGVRGAFRRLGEAVDRPLQLRHALLRLLDDRLLLEDGGLLLENDLDQFGLGKLLQLLACHGRAPCCHGECVWAAW